MSCWMSSLGVNSGIIPRLVGEVLSLLLYRGACFLISKYAIDSEVSINKSKILWFICAFFTRCISAHNQGLKNDKIKAQSSHVFHAFILLHMKISHACQICHVEGRLKAFERQVKDIIPST